jgi:hypothetical protein
LNGQGHARPENHVSEPIVPPEKKQKETLAAGYDPDDAAAAVSNE